MAPVELREVESFLTVAEELHFGRAAERLYLSPARVSQVIRALEDRIGTRLFERTSRRVRLTPIGEKLRDRLAPAYTELLQALETARDLTAGVVGELRIHMPSLSALGPSFDRIRDRFGERHPGCRVLVREDIPVRSLVALRRGGCDLLATWLPLTQPGLTVGPVLTGEQRVLLVKAGHPLLAKGHATIEDLADYAVADVEAVLAAETAQAFCPRHTPSGRPISRQQELVGVSDVLSAVAEGVIVHPTVASFPNHYRHPQVTQMPIDGLPALQSALVWVSAHETVRTRAFADLAAEITEPTTTHPQEQPSQSP